MILFFILNDYQIKQYAAITLKRKDFHKIYRIIRYYSKKGDDSMSYMSWMFVSSMSSAFIASLVFIFLFIRDKNAYLGVIALGWNIFFIHRLLGFFNISKHIKIFSSLRYVLYFICVFLFIYGIHLFFQQPMKKWWIAIFGVCITYKIIENITDSLYILDRILLILPYVVLAWSGITIIKYPKNIGIGKYIVGWDFIIWGINLIFFTYLGNDSRFIPIANIIFSLIFNVFAFSGVILYFESILQKLEKSEERYKLLVELSPDAIGISIDGKIVFANKAALNLLKTDNIEKIKGEKLENFLHEDYYKHGQEKITISPNTKEKPHLNEIKIKALDGTDIDIETAIAAINYDDKSGILCIARDITERKRAERLKKSVEEKTRLLKEAEKLENLRNEFFANISHELRTPLNIILGSIQLLEMYNNDECKKISINKEKYINIIKQNCYRLLKLVNNLIDITKIDTGFYKTDFQNCNIVDVVENITLSVVDYAKNKDISLIFDTNVEEKIIACDPDKMERIILNLLANAIKFTERQGNILVKINDNIDNIDISIKDDGIGIPEDEQQIIFERFKQVESTLSRSKQGSGIGLSLVKSLVEMHDGTISVKSEYGKGTEFIINFPVRTILEENITKNNNFSINQTLIERISIEFSDIYGA
ncbi:PAS domain S-box-containing protein [Paramaledivibacter caminithermalis DSM 15212]|uniref:histidine kinase n=2 Tax=Paramaledivibacter TaxID=1884934 RepID=A0A1M6SG48_PARC5|nr:PAS domain S-box-containing protein [Paramaledivibacter caminithermalis DSM 15212]